MKPMSEPLLHPVRIIDLRPTQITVGLREVAFKRTAWREHLDRDGPEFLGRHMIPVVRGPGGRLHMVDHHHLARALFEEGVEHVLVRTLADLGHLGRSAFETFLDNRAWLHPYDEKGHRRSLTDIPRHVGQLVDDPYRSLAGALRRAGGYAKSDAPFAEFLWADYLRRRIGHRKVTGKFDRALDRAIELARSRDAAYLPGWAGVSGD